MNTTSYLPFIIKPIGKFKCSNLEFDKRYLLIRLARSSWDHCNYVAESLNYKTLTKWRMHTRGEFIKLYWPAKGIPEYIQNGFQVHIIFLKYRTIFRCIIRLMVLKKRADTRILARKSLKIANLFRGIGHTNLNHYIGNFV